MDEKNNRRDFLITLTALVPGLSLLTGCAAGTLPMYQYQGTQRPVTLRLSEYPELLAEDGAIQLRVDQVAVPITIARVADREYVALLPICTHLGCAVKKERSFFRCPCHGSTYSLDGTVVRGPAEESLTRYITELLNETLTIHV